MEKMKGSALMKKGQLLAVWDDHKNKGDSIMNNYQKYESIKKSLLGIGLNSQQHEEILKAIAKVLKI